MNKDIIEEHNKLADQGIYSYWLKMNHFGDLVRVLTRCIRHFSPLTKGTLYLLD